MKLRKVLSTLLAFALSVTGLSVTLFAQVQGNWRAESKTARSITGDLVFGSERLSLNFMTFPVAEIRPLTQDEVLAAFSSAEGGKGTGHLYRLSIPGEKRFLHKNNLCAGLETQWMATYRNGKNLDLAFFSNAAPPVFTVEALNTSVNLCGTFSYTRW